MNRPNVDQIINLLNEIENIRFVLDEQTYGTQKELLGLFENKYTLTEIKNCLKSEKETDELSSDLKNILSQRWESIRGSMMCYTRQPTNLVNRFCYDLAQILSPLPEDLDDMTEEEGPYFLLMPSLKIHEDIKGSNIHEFKLTQFVLSDDHSLIIPIEDCLDYASKTDTGELVHTLSEDKSSYPLLSNSERKLIVNHSIDAQNYYYAVRAYNKKRIHGVDIESALRRLIAALREGGSRKRGSEFRAGSAANIGLAEFSKFWESCSVQQKENCYRTYPNLEDNLKLLMEPDTTVQKEWSQSSLYCVQLIADTLEDILNRTPTPKKEQLKKEVERAQQKFHEQSKKPDYSMQIPKERAPKVLAKIYNLTCKEQKNIFTINKAADAFDYVLNYDLDALEELKDIFLNNTEKAQFINQADYKGNTPLILAAKGGSLKAVWTLISLGGKINAQNNKGETALHSAIRAKNFSVAEMLLQYTNINITIKNKQHQNALDCAIESCPNLINSLLLKAVILEADQQKDFLAREQKNGQYLTILMYALRKNPDTLAALLDLAIKANSQLVKPFLNTKFHFDNTSSNSLLHFAALRGDTALTTLLQNYKVNINVQNNQGNTALHQAIKSQSPAIVDILLHDENIDILIENKDKQNALSYALQHCTYLVGSIVLKAVTLSETNQQIFLNQIAKGKYQDVLSYVAHDYPALIAPVLKSSIKIKSRFVTPFIEFTTTTDDTQLHLAVRRQDFELARILLDSGLDVNAQNEEGNTPLHVAIFSKCTHSIKILLENSTTNLCLKSLMGRNAMTYALMHNPSAIELLLLRAVTSDLLIQEELLSTVKKGAYNHCLTYAEVEFPELFNKLTSKLAACNNVNYNEVDALLQSTQFDTYMKKFKKLLLASGENKNTVLNAQIFITELASAKAKLYLGNDSIEEKQTLFNEQCIVAVEKAKLTLGVEPVWLAALKYFLVAITFPISLPLLALGVFSLKNKNTQQMDQFIDDLDLYSPELEATQN